MSYQLPGEMVSQPAAENVKGFVTPMDTYRPANPIEFNSKGECLVFTSRPQKYFSVFFPVPWSLGTWSIPVVLSQVLAGNIAMSLPLAAGLYAAILPHCYYLYNLRFTIDRIWYVRGGYWKIENSGIQGIHTTTTMPPDNLTLAKGTAELNSEGQLDSDLNFVAEEWHEFYEVEQNNTLKVIKQGKVVNPELFQAMLKKVRIDDTKFIVNLQI
jgi:hypothetical protein